MNIKKEIINSVLILGIGLKEIILDIDLGFIMINSIEIRNYNEIILHSFSEDMDYEIEFSDLEKSYQQYIYQLITILVYN